MTEEKILWFLGLNKDQKMDKFLMKYAFSFDFITTIVILCGCLLFKIIPLTLSNTIVSFCFILSDMLFVLFFKLIKTIIYVYYYSFIVFISNIVKFLYGFAMFSRFELVEKGYPVFTLLHLFVLIVSVFFSIFFMLKFYIVYRDLKTHTINEVEIKLKKKKKKYTKTKTSKIVLRIFCGLCGISPFALSRLFRVSFPDFGLGFGFWLFFCIWILITSLFLPKFIVSIKYNAPQYFKKQFNDE